MARKTVVTVDVPETATTEEFLTALWDDDTDTEALFTDDTVSTDDDGTYTVTDDSGTETRYVSTTRLPDVRVTLDSLTFSDVAVQRWVHESRRLPKAVARRLLSILASAADDKDNASILASMAAGEAVSKTAARQALRSFTVAPVFGPWPSDWHPAWSVIGLDSMAALLDWSGVNSK